ncbi:MAG: PEP-CTERM sorting domain-containing protein [Verrucomicrobiales bacterium]
MLLFIPGAHFVFSIVGLLSIAAINVSAGDNPAIGEPWIVDTSIADPLQSQVFQIPPSITLENRIQYEVGFATFEQPQLNFLFDSLTVSLARRDGADSIILATADVFGLAIAPLTPGGLLFEGGINVTAAPGSVELFEGAHVSFAYHIELLLPPSLTGSELQTSFNFFNNGDAVASQAYAVVVPEPSIITMVIIGGALGCFQWKRRNRIKC